MPVWHESDEFWEVMAPMLFFDERWAAVPTEVDQIVALLDISPGIAVLDLACGPGRHSLELARRQFQVTGVDRTALFLERARESAGKQGLAIELIQEDMRRFCRTDAFDAAMLMFTSFGYFEEPAENRQVLANIFRSLKEGGMLILDLMGKEVLARIFLEQNWDEVDGAFLLQERRVVNNWSWIENRWILLRDQERHEFQVSHWLYSAAELVALLQEVGFGLVTTYGDLEGSPYDHKARRLVVVARKPVVEQEETERTEI